MATWWRANRPAAPDLFEYKLDRAIYWLAERSEFGRIYQKLDERVVRRVLLEKTGQYVYYSTDTARQLVVVHNIWGARRGRAPKL